MLTNTYEDADATTHEVSMYVNVTGINIATHTYYGLIIAFSCAISAVALPSSAFIDCNIFVM